MDLDNIVHVRIHARAAEARIVELEIALRDMTFAREHAESETVRLRERLAEWERYRSVLLAHGINGPSVLP